MALGYNISVEKPPARIRAVRYSFTLNQRITLLAPPPPKKKKICSCKHMN